MLTVFHGQNFQNIIEDMDVGDEVKQEFNEMISTFLKDLFEVADFVPPVELT